MIIVFFLLYFASKAIIENLVHSKLQNELQVVSNKKVTQFYTATLDKQETVKAISQSALFLEFIQGHKDINIIKDLFLTLSKPNRYMFQLRYIDKNGQEVIRVDKSKENKSYLTPKDKLQNKKSRYYFQNTKKLNPSEIWYSKLDLNIEHGKIENPIRPTLRIATPIFNRTDFEGIIIANISAKHLLYNTFKDENYDMFIIDKDGEYLYHKNPKYSWSKYLEKNENIFNQFPSLTKKDLFKEKFYNNHHYFQKLYLDNSEGLFLVIKIKQSALESLYNSYFKTFLEYLFLILIVLSFIAYYLYTRKEKEQNEQLYKSEKMAAMGEMIGNIAHQWRQPLSVISSGATGMLMQKQFASLDDEQFEKTCNAINDNAQYLSKTIDDFKNFIKNERVLKTFNLKKTVEEFLNIVNPSFKRHNIEVLVSIDSSMNVNGYPNELTQCFINIYNNAKDALRESPHPLKLIFIDALSEDENIVIKIRDNAGGIPKDVLPRVFDPYFTTKHKSNGTGLGLHMTYNLITEGMKGEINTSNVTFNHKGDYYTGAEFTITLPKSIKSC